VNGPELSSEVANKVDSIAAASGRRDVTSGSHDPILTADANGQILTVSASAARVFGWSTNDLIGLTLGTIVPEWDSSRPSPELSALLRARSPVVVGRMHRVAGVRKDGRTVPLDVAMTRITVSEDDDPVLVAVLRDVSEQMLEERSLRLERDLALAAIAADGLQGAFQRLVAKFGRATGLDYGEGWILDEALQQIVPLVSWSSPDATVDALRRTIDERTLPRGAGLAGRVLADGRLAVLSDMAELRSIEDWRAGVLDAAGCRLGIAAPLRSGAEAIGVMLFFSMSVRRDVDEIRELLEQAVEPLGVILDRKRARDRLAAHEVELEEEIGRRAAEIEALERRQHALDRAVTLGTLTAGVCHDMQNILLPVRAHLDALLQDE